MTDNIEKKIRAARPSLRMARPLPYWIVTIFAAFNIVLGISLFIAFDAGRITTSLLIVNEVFTFRLWGIIFIALGVLKLFALKTNNWGLARHSLLTGVVIKAAWAIALTIRSFVSPGTLLLNSMWVALALIQMATFIFFMPPDEKKEVGDE